MSRSTLVAATALAATAAGALALLPSSPAGSATSCVAWAALPQRVTVHTGRPTTVRITLQATPACAGASFDNGATATLRGPGSSPNARFPLHFAHIGSTDTITLYGGINPLGTYRIAGGNLRTYDALSKHIPFTWRATSTFVR